MTPLELEQEGQRVRALVRSGIDKIRSAMKVTETVARELTAEEFLDWCRNSAHMPQFLSEINKVLDLALDRESNRQAAEALRRAKQVEASRKQAEREAERQAREQARFAEEKAKIERAAELEATKRKCAADSLANRWAVA
jgi:predicted ribosome quality control (RQC) complex YloA/Tae2 family protein